MNMGKCRCLKRLTLSLVFSISICLFAVDGFSYPVEFKDSRGKNIIITKRPSRVVALVPSMTEIIFRIGAGDAIKAVTYHDAYPRETTSKEIVGGFFSPSLDRVESMKPDVVFYSDLQKGVKERFADKDCILINLDMPSIEKSYETILLVGKIFDRDDRARALVDEIKRELQVIAKKVAKIPEFRRKRVIRLMGRDQVMTPGEDSFQNDLIRMAGGIPPDFGKKGNIVTVSKEEWVRFNPQVIYGCGGDEEVAKRFFNRMGWQDVDAVRNGHIYYFPCELTCRVATNTDYFVKWLSSTIYPDEYVKKENQILEDHIFNSRPIDLNLIYVKGARIAYSHIHDFLNKSLIIDFKEPMTIVSTLEGQRSGIMSVGNHYSSPPHWSLGHQLGLEKLRGRIYHVIDRSEADSSFLFTGADMDNLAIKRQRFKDMEVCVLATGGAETNAVRMSRDEGRYYEPGTINIIIMSNMRLTPRAMTRAIISATEAKSAAIQDFDVRSSYSSKINQATGTGTDNVLVVEGRGTLLKNAGGHSKLGELIAKAVYEAVQEALYMQNSTVTQRNIFRRLKERGITLYGLVRVDECECNIVESDMVSALEAVLLEPQYASFLESALSISDDYEKGLIKQVEPFKIWCHITAEEIAGKEIPTMLNMVETGDIPVVLKMALNAVLNGAYYKMK